MEQEQNFSDVLFQAVMERQKMFDSFLLPKMQEEYRISQSAAKTIRTVLIKKGIIHDDPYKYDSKINEIQVPPEDSFTDTERAAVIGRRLSQYEAMLDYMSNYYSFTCDFITTDRVGKLVALNRTFTWEAFSNTSTRVNTKGLADLVYNLRSGNDPLSISIVNDALTQLSKSTQNITKTLKGLTEFHRERYKVAVRKLVMPGAVIDPDRVLTNMRDTVNEIKRSFAATMKGQPFYNELIEEILKEDYSPDHAVMQQELLARLSVAQADTAKAAKQETLKPVLMDGVRILGGVSPQMDELAVKIAENHHVLKSAERSFFDKLAAVLRKAFNIPEKDEAIQITTVDPITQTGKRESLKVPEFVDELRHRSRIYAGFSIKTSPAYQKIESQEEPEILDLLTRHIAEINVLLKQCAGLDNYFKQNAAPLDRERIRGVKVEISSLRNSLNKANQCRAEYASQLEEQQQLKKLGITNA